MNPNTETRASCKGNSVRDVPRNGLAWSRTSGSSCKADHHRNNLRHKTLHIRSSDPVLGPGAREERVCKYDRLCSGHHGMLLRLSVAVVRRRSHRPQVSARTTLTALLEKGDVKELMKLY